MSAPQRHDCAVAFCCDRNYFHLALFVIWQIAHLNPFRRFDFVIATQDDLEIPGWAKSYGIVMHRTGVLPEAAEAARFSGSMSTVFRIMLARELGDRYRRIIYSDSDMYVDGGDLNRLMEIDLGPHPIAAALDVFFFFVADFRAKEYVSAGLPPMPYANTGFQVIDTKAYREQDVERRSFEVCKTHANAIYLGDQSLTNLALRGKFAQLAPCWNWQLNLRLPLLSQRYPVFFHHFITSIKPNRDSSGALPARFNQAYRDFLTQFRMGSLSELAPPCDPAPISFKESARVVLNHVAATNIFRNILMRFPDPYRARL